MLDETFTFKGYTAKSKGIELQKSISVSPAVPKQSTVIVPGRSGDLHYYEDAFNNRTITASCFILSKTLASTFRAINDWLIGENGYFKFSDGDDTRFYLARCTDGVKWNPRCGLLNPFELTFDAKPQHFLESGDAKAAISLADGLQVTNPTVYKAFPVFELETAENALCESCSVIVAISGGASYTVTFSTLTGASFTGKIVYDTELQMVTNRSDINVIVSGNAAGLYIPGGATVNVSAADQTSPAVLSTAKIQPRWWDV